MKIPHKDYIIPLTSISLFLIIVIYSVYLYFNWNDPLTDSKYSVEVSLPVIDLNSYSNLSKQYK